MSIKASLLLAVASIANANALSKRGAGTSAPSMCSRAWSNIGAAKETDCYGAKVIFSSVNDASDVVTAGLSNPNVKSMAYLSVGTVQEDRPADPRLSDYIWEENDDANGYGGVWGDHWFNPDDLLLNILTIMQDIMKKYKEMGFDAISTDNASPSDAVTDNDSEAAEHHTDQRVDPRYVAYMHGIVDYANSIGLEVALENPSYYIHESSLIGRFDGYIVESLFNWYAYDIDNYNGSPNLLTGSKPTWIFQYEGPNGSNSKLQERMNEQGIDMVYIDTYDGWVEYYANDDE